jgi:predicted RNA-binding Zn-ribbon protein involved in translation (DUF1610 family)
MIISYGIAEGGGSNMYICPVCGYDRLREPADDFLICPSCGTQFGYTDANRSHAELRDIWEHSGMVWFSRRLPQPLDWNPIKQLENLGHRVLTSGYNTVGTTEEANSVLAFWNTLNAENFNIKLGYAT